ncbi:MAG: 2Fe-2S iron-sulfur cluster-binding protein [Methanobrevibacter sp.]|uniref:2Fe-2S iron-sulfur cluster-binding protein n=1 Tax=Methanobrevibacter sp. TaxID=66852 RepID=UPI002E77BC0D|nr:2Fe-2S iron-sulfur cluster-binding protein [Methanobrevibacter sp.]MEE0935377.1 2Fe-2S iron-sulfur cluster-binding protein [Methanobrevibacter sp.]
MSIKVKIKIDGEYQIFDYDGDLNIPVTTLLERLDYPIEYSCSCLQGLCGACAMVINSQPKLACKTFVNDEIMVKEYGIITIEPLSKFPLVKDLKVDRSILHDVMIDCEQWLESDARVSDDLNFDYEMSMCLMCGCCTEACPNYGFDDFVGTQVAVSASKLISQESDSQHSKSIKRKYKDNFYPHCLKTLACEDVCPMKIPTQRAISKMNRKSVWRIWQLLSGDR